MLLKGHLLSGHGGGSLLILLLHLVREPPERLAWPLLLLSAVAQQPTHFPSLCVTEHMLVSSPVFTALAAARGLQFTWRHLLEAATMFILTASFATDTR